VSAPEDTLDRIRLALADRYEILGEIGRGGMSVVFKAHDVRRESPVAVKTLRPELAARLGHDRFLREIQIESKLQHPNITPVYDWGEVEGVPYFVMPFVEGESLRQKLNREGALPVDEAVAIAHEVAGALDYAHRRGFVHRDIKPGNILLTSGHAVVTDFGIARAISEAGQAGKLTRTGESVGTPEYMSPEQLGGGGPLDGRSDVYSLACVMYEMLAGEPPFSGPSFAAIASKHLAAQPPQPSVIRSTLPGGLDGVIVSALAKVPADRPRTAVEFTEAVRAALISKEPSPPAPGRRRPRVVPLVLVGVLAVAGYLFSRLIGSEQPDLDDETVVVFPLVERGSRPAALETGHDIAIVLEAALVHADPLRFVDGWLWLDEAGRRDVTTVTAGEALRLARDRLAGWYIDGALISTLDSTTVMLWLHSSEDGRVVSEHSASGPRDAPAHQIALQSIRRLLPEIVDPGREIDLAPLMERQPGAVALWIQAQRQYRRSNFQSALDLYHRAIETDSSLVLAAVKGAQAASWTVQLGEAAQLIDVALKRKDLLPERYARFAEGLRAYLAGDSDAAVALLGEAVTADPGWAEAHMALAEVYYHLLPSPMETDSVAQTFGEPFFERALAVDPEFTPPLYHLAQMAIGRGDVVRANRLLQRYEQSDPERALIDELKLMLECVEDGPDATLLNQATGANPDVVLRAANMLAAKLSRPPCAEAAYRAILTTESVPRAQRWNAFVGMQGLLIAHGRDRDAMVLLDSAVNAGELGAHLVSLLEAGLSPEVEARGARAQVVAVRAFGERYEGAVDHFTRFALARWHARGGDLEVAESLATSLAEPTWMARALAARIALARRDTTEATARYRQLTADGRGLQWDLARSLGAERVQLAELLLAAGEFQAAHDVAARLDHPMIVSFLPYIPSSLAIRRDAMAAVRRQDLVSEYSQRLSLLGTEFTIR
jgi:tetratricopeptide (TPR) repeat protein